MGCQVMTICNPDLLSPEQEAEEGVEARGDLALAGGLDVLQNLSVWKSPVKMGKRVTMEHRTCCISPKRSSLMRLSQLL